MSHAVAVTHTTSDAAFLRSVGVALASAGAIGIGLAFGLIQTRLNEVWGDERA